MTHSPGRIRKAAPSGLPAQRFPVRGCRGVRQVPVHLLPPSGRGAGRAAARGRGSGGEEEGEEEVEEGGEEKAREEGEEEEGEG